MVSSLVYLWGPAPMVVLSDFGFNTELTAMTIPGAFRLAASCGNYTEPGGCGTTGLWLPAPWF